MNLNNKTIVITGGSHGLGLDSSDPKPSCVMWLTWRDGKISFIRDYRYVRYVIAEAELTLAPS